MLATARSRETANAVDVGIAAAHPRHPMAKQWQAGAERADDRRRPSRVSALNGDRSRRCLPPCTALPHSLAMAMARMPLPLPTSTALADLARIERRQHLEQPRVVACVPVPRRDRRQS